MLRWANSQMLLVTTVFHQSLFCISKFIFQKSEKIVYLIGRYEYFVAFKRWVSMNFDHLLFLFQKIIQRLFLVKIVVYSVKFYEIFLKSDSLIVLFFFLWTIINSSWEEGCRDVNLELSRASIMEPFWEIVNDF